MSKVKVTYFDARGRAEIIRLVLKASKIEFEDVRIAKADWPTVKATTPTGQLPVVEYEGHQLTQSMAIARTIAKKHNLMGKDDTEYYRVERTLGQIGDVMDLLFKIFFTPEEKKEQARTDFIEVTGKHQLKVLEGFIKDTGFFVGENVTLAELAFIALMDYLVKYQTLIDQFPKLTELRDKILNANAEVNDWVKNRPVTDM